MIYSIRYTQTDPSRSQPITLSFIKNANTAEEAMALAIPHLKFLKSRTSEAINFKDILEFG